jgi:hypothetical protein
LKLEKGHCEENGETKRGKPLKTKDSAKIADSAPLMISMAYTSNAKCLVSFSETTPFVFAIFGLVKA